MTNEDKHFKTRLGYLKTNIELLICEVEASANKVKYKTLENNLKELQSTISKMINNSFPDKESSRSTKGVF